VASLINCLPCGVFAAAAPVGVQEYDGEAADVWSAGVILCMMVSADDARRPANHSLRCLVGWKSTTGMPKRKAHVLLWSAYCSKLQEQACACVP
jgi:hypothetical protein